MNTLLALAIPAAAVLAALVALEGSPALAVGMLVVASGAFWRFALH